MECFTTIGSCSLVNLQVCTIRMYVIIQLIALGRLFIKLCPVFCFFICYIALMLQKSNVFFIFIRLSALRLQMANVSSGFISSVINHFSEEDILLAPICRHKFINCFKIPAWSNIQRYESGFLEWEKL